MEILVWILLIGLVLVWAVHSPSQPAWFDDPSPFNPTHPVYFRIHPDQAWEGTSYSERKPVSLVTCATACLNDPKCVAFNYEVPEQRCLFLGHPFDSHQQAQSTPNYVAGQQFILGI